MMNGSDSRSFNDSIHDDEFSCSLPDLSASNVTNHDFWTISSVYMFGTPLAAVLKFLVVFVLSIIYIPLIILAMAKKKNYRNKVHDVIFINHSVTSVLLALVLLIFSVVFEFSRGAEFIYGGSDSAHCGVCAFAGFLLILLNTILLHNLALHSIWFYILFSHPIGNKFTAKKVALCIFLIWFISFWVAIPPVIGFGSFEFDRDFGACIPRLTGVSKTGTENRAYVAFLLLEPLLPVGLSFILNLQSTKTTILNTVRSSSQRMNTTYGWFDGSQRLLEAFLSFMLPSVLYLPIIIISFLIIGKSPDNFPRELLVICWLLYIFNPLFQTPVYTQRFDLIIRLLT